MEQSKIEDYAEELENAFYMLLDSYGIENNGKNTKNLVDSIFIALYSKIYKPDRKTSNGQKSKLIYYDFENMERLVNKYVEISLRFNVFPKVEVFCSMTGISKTILYRWHEANKGNGNIIKISSMQSQEEKEIEFYPFKVPERLNNAHLSMEDRELSSFRVDAVKIIQAASKVVNKNNLSDSPLGNGMIANNDIETGYMWDARRQLTAATIEQNKATLGAQELPKLTDNI